MFQFSSVKKIREVEIDATGEIGLVKDIYSDPESSSPEYLSSSPENLTEFQGQLVFSAYDSEHGRELYITNDTNESPQILSDAWPGLAGSSPRELTVCGSYLYFVAEDGFHGAELWRSDGTEEGTLPVREIREDTGKKIIVSSTGPLVTTELGTTARFTVVLTEQPTDDVEIGVVSSDSSEGQASLSTIVFTTMNWDQPQTVTVTGQNDHEMDGDAEYSIVLNASSSNDTNFDALDPDDVSLINLDDEGTRILIIPESGALEVTEGGAYARYSVVLTSELLASDLDEDEDQELIIQVVTDQQIVTDQTTLVFTPQNWNQPQIVYVTACDDGLGEGPGLSAIAHAIFTVGTTAYDGLTIEDMTVQISDNDLPAIPSELTAVGDSLFFKGYEPITGNELWSSDGTRDGTVLVKDINPNGSSELSHLVSAGNLLYFTASDGVHGTELWISNGTEVGTKWMADRNSGIADSDPGNLTAVGSSVYFTAFNPTTGIELYNTDGTRENTGIVRDINTTGSSMPSGFIAVDSHLYFVADDAVHGRSLWISNGDQESTRYVPLAGIDITIGPAPESAPLVAMGYGESNAESSLLEFTVAEGGNELQYSVVLSTQPTSNVIVDVTGDKQLNVSTPQLIFTPTDWDQPQAVTVAAVQDDKVEGDHSSIVTHSFTSDDPIYNAMANETVTVNITDDDGPLAGVSVEFTDAYGDALTNLRVDDEFRIYVYAQDLRTLADGKGVTSAIVDMLYDTSRIDVTGITHLGPFDTVISGSFDDTTGVVDEVGGGDMLNRRINRGSQAVFYLDAIAIASGDLIVQTQQADDIASAVTLDGMTTDVRSSTQYGEGTVRIYATDGTNNAPAVTTDNDTISVDEGDIASNTGTFDDFDSGDNVTISSSIGTITQVGTQSGTWNWSFDTIDGPDGDQVVTITATDSSGAKTSTTFDMSIVMVMGVRARDGVLQILGTEADDSVIVTQQGNGQVKVTAPSLGVLGEIFSGVDQINAQMFGGNDIIRFNGLTIPVNVDGGTGNDHLYGSSASDLLIGGPGNDRLYGGSGDDTLIAGAGYDYLDGGSGNDFIDGGDDNDRLYGQSGNDSILGGTGEDRIFAGIGNDLADGGADVDYIDGSLGDDMLIGGDGDDYLNGSFDNDTLYGGADNDHLYGSFGDDKLYGESGTDRLYGSFGDDQLIDDATDSFFNTGTGISDSISEESSLNPRTTSELALEQWAAFWESYMHTQDEDHDKERRDAIEVDASYEQLIDTIFGDLDN